MSTFIISSKNFEKALEKVKEINKENKVDKFDIQILEFEKALGIEDVRNIQKKIFLKPFRGNRKSTVLVLANGATVEAQNSMLKLLEEPPPSSLIFLVTDNYNFFLPTILSRCKLIDLNIEVNKISNKESYSNILKNLRITNSGQALKLAEDLSGDSEDAVIWLENAILALREEMLDNLEDKQKTLSLRKLIHKLELAHYDLKNTNVNSRLALENLFLNI